MPPTNSNPKDWTLGRLDGRAEGLTSESAEFAKLNAEEGRHSGVPDLDNRRDARVPVDVPAHSTSGAHSVVGTLQNLSLGGALLITSVNAMPPTGAGLEVAFRLPTGPQLRLSSTVRWNRTDEPPRSASSGLQFLNVSGANRSYLEHYVELTASSGVEQLVRTEVTSKYRLSFDAAGRAIATLGGMLTREEAQSFVALLKQRMMARKATRTHFAFDVRRLSVCSQDVVVELKQCFDLFAQRADVCGFLIGNRSLALTQLVRAARDAGIADHVFCVNEPEDASRIWAQLEG